MGNQQPKHLEEQQNHERLGPVRITEEKDPQTDEVYFYLELDKIIESERVYNDWRTDMIRVDDTQARDILLLPKSYKFHKSGMCSSSGTLHAVYENLSYVLKGEIQNRYKLNRYFEERQIWYLLYNMIRAGKKFEGIKRKVGNMHPNNILINDDGQIKIISTVSIPGQPDNFQLMTQNTSAQAYLAPQQLANDSVLNAMYPPNVDQCLAQVFSIGLTILSAGTLQNCQELYEKRNNTIKENPNILQELLRSFKDNYSSFLYQTVQSMVARANIRKRSSEIYDMLCKYESEILDLQPFEFPERYTIPSQPHLTGNSNYFPQNRLQNLPQTANSNIYASNIHPQITQYQNVIPVVQINQSKMERSGMPVQHVPSVQFFTNSKMPQNMNFSNQFQPILSPTNQQSGIYVQRQSFGPAFNNSAMKSSSSVMQGSSYQPVYALNSVQPVQQSNIHNVNVTQSNYIPNYQLKY